MLSALHNTAWSSSLVSMPSLIAAIPIGCPVGSWIEDCIEGILSGGSMAPTPFGLPVALWSLISVLFMAAAAAYVFVLIIVLMVLAKRCGGFKSLTCVKVQDLDGATCTSLY